MAEASSGTRAQRVAAVLLLLAAGILSLPVVAYFLDGEDQENWIVPVQLAAMAIVGAVVGSFLPGLAGESASPGRARLLGAVVGIVMALVGVLIFFVLISGFDGA